MKSILSLLSMTVILTACQHNAALNNETHSVTSSIPTSLSAMRTLNSIQSFEATESQLRSALDSRNLKLFTVVDHGAGAQSIGANIGQSKLFIFGNPKSGTPLMQAEPALGLALPMKILLRESGGTVSLHRTDVAATVRSYGVSGQDARLEKISMTLDAIMDDAAGE